MDANSWHGEQVRTSAFAGEKLHAAGYSFISVKFRIAEPCASMNKDSKRAELVSFDVGDGWSLL